MSLCLLLSLMLRDVVVAQMEDCSGRMKCRRARRLRCERRLLVLRRLLRGLNCRLRAESFENHHAQDHNKLVFASCCFSPFTHSTRNRQSLIADCVFFFASCSTHSDGANTAADRCERCDEHANCAERLGEQPRRQHDDHSTDHRWLHRFSSARAGRCALSRLHVAPKFRARRLVLS